MRVIAIAALLAASAGCADSPMAVASNYRKSIEPVAFRVEIPRSHLKTMQVYVHPSLTRAFVMPLQREATAESLSMGADNWAARAQELIPAYKAALHAALKERGADCRSTNPIAFADVFGFEFTLACHGE